MAQNVEIKAKLSDPTQVLRFAQQISDSPAHTFRQTDTFFKVPTGRLKVRKFDDGTGELIGYVRPDQSGPKLSEYLRTPVLDPDSLKKTLGLIFEIKGVVSKRRTLLQVGQTRIHFDEVDGLGSFIELEVVLSDSQSVSEGDQIAQTLMNRLEIPKSQLITHAYIDLLSGKSQ